jgi:hypothetical protein
MSVRIISDQYDDMAVLYDSVTETAFGMIVRSTDEGDIGATEVAEKFLDWLECDARERRSDQIREDYNAFLAEIERDGWEAVVGEEVAT